jgi:hypothetical protein
VTDSGEGVPPVQPEPGVAEIENVVLPVGVAPVVVMWNVVESDPPPAPEKVVLPKTADAPVGSAAPVLVNVTLQLVALPPKVSDRVP